MAVNRQQLEQFVIRPSLEAIGLLSDDAVALMLGTAAQESLMGTYITQMNLGFRGGLGIFQMEGRTYDDIWGSVVENNRIMKAKIMLFLCCNGKPPASRLVSDLSLAAVMTRLYYSRIRESLPKADDILGMANYWKKYYNTNLGKGKVEDFVANYKALVL